MTYEVDVLELGSLAALEMIGENYGPDDFRQRWIGITAVEPGDRVEG